MRNLALTLGVALTLIPSVAHAQTPAPEHRVVAFADIGFARTIADESLLGDGPSISGGMGFRLASGKTIQGLVDYVSYDHGGQSVSVDGRAVFIGAEVAFHSSRPRVMPFVTVGGGFFDVHEIVTTRREISPGRTIVDPPVTRDLTPKGATVSGGIDVRIAEHASIRFGGRLHVVLDQQQAEDVVPFMIFRPSVGVVWRW